MKKLSYIIVTFIVFMNSLHGQCITQKKTDRTNHFILVVDKSGSMHGTALDNIKTALTNFVQDMQNNDNLSLVLFDDKVSVTQNCTSNKTILYRSINNFDAGGGTALYDALGKASILAHNHQGQKIIIFFTDGEDNSSHLSIYDIKSIALSRGIYVYGIGLGEVNREVLPAIARETSGGLMVTDNSAQLKNLYAKVLSNYYKIFDQKKQYTSRLIINSHPSKKPVYVNGKKMTHTTPFILENLTPGKYDVVIKFDRGQWQCSDKLVAGFTGIIDARESDLGRDLIITSDVKNAMVFIDGDFVGYTSKYPFTKETVKNGWFSKKTRYNFDKQLLVKNIASGSHKIKLLGLSDMKGFFPPLEQRFEIKNKDLIVKGNFLQNNIEIRGTKKVLRNSKRNSPYDKVEDIFNELE